MRCAVRCEVDDASARDVRPRRGRPTHQRPARCSMPNSGTRRQPRSVDTPPWLHQLGAAPVRWCRWGKTAPDLRHGRRRGVASPCISSFRRGGPGGLDRRVATSRSRSLLVNSFTKWSGPLRSSIWRPDPRDAIALSRGCPERSGLTLEPWLAGSKYGCPQSPTKRCGTSHSCPLEGPRNRVLAGLCEGSLCWRSLALVTTRSLAGRWAPRGRSRRRARRGNRRRPEAGSAGH